MKAANSKKKIVMMISKQLIKRYKYIFNCTYSETIKSDMNKNLDIQMQVKRWSWFSYKSLLG